MDLPMAMVYRIVKLRPVADSINKIDTTRAATVSSIHITSNSNQAKIPREFLDLNKTKSLKVLWVIFSHVAMCN